MADCSLCRCPWPGSDPLYVAYHDDEWGTPVRDDGKLFEFLLLEGAQAGLSWITILRRREGYRRAFDGFDPEKIARYDERKIAVLLGDTGIVRNRRKIEGAVNNARAYLRLQETGRTLSSFLWGFVDGKPIVNVTDHFSTTTPLSDLIARDLRKRGMRYMGSVTVYSLLQAVGHDGIGDLVGNVAAVG
ncbi:MAG: DNA-3-methyladenine glycosylase I, partial [Synergistales bacterium]|nr:DNA-3-methyladenine glycosylase I [Synergistales bacterium]